MVDGRVHGTPQKIEAATAITAPARQGGADAGIRQRLLGLAGEIRALGVQVEGPRTS